MGTEILIDTNVVIDYLAGRLPENAIKQIDNLFFKKEAKISIIVKIELLSFNPPNPNDLVVVEQFINKCTVFSLTEDIVEKTYLLRRKHRIKLPDAMIAATALVHNLAIFTRNTSDFNGLEGLTVIDSYNL